jgi:hypothetical protein
MYAFHHERGVCHELETEKMRYRRSRDNRSWRRLVCNRNGIVPTFYLHVLKVAVMLSQNQSRYLVTICFTLLALLFASDLLLKPPKELVLLAIDCISALYFTATLFVGLKERKKGAVAASAVCLIITIASFFI